MPENELKQLESYCQDFSKFRQIQADGNGQNLHDLKNTFDYVVKTIQEYKIEQTIFGSELGKQVKNANNILSELWNCLNDLETALKSFIEDQRANNSKTYN